MIEEIVKNYLKENLKGKNVYLQLPANPAGEYLLIERVGGGETDHIRSASFAIKSYGDSLIAAASLNEEVKAAMKNIVMLNDIGSCSLDSDYNYTDSRKGNFRYQAIFDLKY